MDSKVFMELAKKAVLDYFNKHTDPTDETCMSIEDVYVVWSCKILQHNKAMLSTTAPDGMYYECTFNGDTNEIYLDAYKRWDQEVIKNERGK